MKINEVTNVAPHPGLARAQDYTTLMVSGEERMDDMVAFIMDDNNAKQRRLMLLRHFDSLLGDEQEVYTEEDLEEFMHDQGELSPEEADGVARDYGDAPYHLKSVDEETFSTDADIPTGEYEICDRCFGDGCPECDGGLNDVTGKFRMPDFGDEE